MFSFPFPSVKRSILEQMSENVPSRFSVLCRHRKRVHKVHKELMQFDCTTCFISYFIGKCKVRLFVVGVLKTVLTWSVELNAELEQGDYVPWSLVVGGVSAIIFF